MINAWRALDPQGHGRISFFHFTRAGHHLLSHAYDMKKLWMDLDTDQDGFITLEDFDPAVAGLLKEFSQVISKSCGSCSAAWSRKFSRSMQGRCRLDRFTQVAFEL